MKPYIFYEKETKIFFKISRLVSFDIFSMKISWNYWIVLIELNAASSKIKKLKSQFLRVMKYAILV